MPKRLATLLALSALALAARAADNRLAPIPREQAISTHGPYEMGACETCHQRHDAANPGPALKISNDLCYECHDEFKGSAPVKMEKSFHPTVKADCTLCHNPHNAKKKRLRL
ncbi:MAG TPA: cytochrome c3 family protein [Anaeromyxobacter sp.]|nr:cytochrome c3 family protein [Anaeromyxobacter sp.]